MFTTRLVSGIVLVILAVLIVGTGGALLFAVTAALSLIGMFELYRVVEIEKKAPGIAGYAAGIFYYALLWFHRENYVVLMAIAALMILMAIYVITFPHYRTEQVTVAFRYFLSGCNAGPLPVSGAGNDRRKVSGMADRAEFLGLRYLRLTVWACCLENTS